MRLVLKNEQILHVYFVAKKKKKLIFLFYIYNFYFENLIYEWIKQFENQRESDPIFVIHACNEGFFFFFGHNFSFISI